MLDVIGTTSAPRASAKVGATGATVFAREKTDTWIPAFTVMGRSVLWSTLGAPLVNQGRVLKVSVAATECGQEVGLRVCQPLRIMTRVVWTRNQVLGICR